jgi:hypothetical protein
MKKLSFFIAAFAMICLASCGTKSSQAYYDAPSQLLSSNYDGTFVIRTQVRARNAAIAFTDAQRKVVQEVIFDGIQSAHSGTEGLKPLCFDKNAKEKHEDYFRVFFQDNGPWKKYVDLRDKRTTTTRYQRDGRQMIETVTVSVDRAALKDRLVADGIIPPGGRY